MAKLYFRYGTMGSSKTANALMIRYNYIEKGFTVMLFKPSVDTRNGENVVMSRIGLSADCLSILPDFNFIDNLKKNITGSTLTCKEKSNIVLMVDEAQFLSTMQVDQLKKIAVFYNKPVMCFGLLTDFQTHLFPGSKRLIELADSIQEIKSICRCGAKATINARICNGKIITNGKQIQIGGNESYESMCYKCWIEHLQLQQNSLRKK